MFSFLIFSLFLSPSSLQHHHSANIPLLRKDTPYCMRPLLATYEVPLGNIRCSKYGKLLYLDEVEKLRPGGEAWCGERLRWTWAEVDLERTRLVAGVMVEGGSKAENAPWTNVPTHYYVQFSPDGRVWNYIPDRFGDRQQFTVIEEFQNLAFSPKDYNSTSQFSRAHYQPFDPPIHARFIRVTLTAHSKGSCINLEVFGCDSDWAATNAQETKIKPLPKGKCHPKTQIGMEDRRIQDWQISASSFTAPYHPSKARIYGPLGWCATSTTRPYIKVDLRTNYKIHGIGVQGVKSTKPQPNYWLVKEYRVYTAVTRHGVWSLRGASYSGPSDPSDGSHKHVVMKVPTVARYVKIEVVGYHTKPCLRFELYGCTERALSLGLTDNGTKRIPWNDLFTSNYANTKLPPLALDDKKPSWIGDKLPGFIKAEAWPQVSQPFIQMDLGSLRMITRLGLNGQLTASNEFECHVSSIFLMYSPDARTWGMVRHADAGIYNEFKAKIIPATGHGGIPPVRETKYMGTGPFFTDISPAVYARHIKILLFENYGGWCLKLELYGNDAFYQKNPDNVKRRKGCDEALGMQSGRIKERQIRGSSFTKIWANAKPGDARLHKTGGWCVNTMDHDNIYSPFHLYAMNDTLEIDLLSEMIVDGFATQGHSSHAKWVAGYVVHYSVDGLSWDIISVKHSGEMRSEKFFEGNSNNAGVVRHRLNPRIRARFLRFVPMVWHKWICMRVEVFGCSGGKSLKEELDEQILELESDRVDFLPLKSKERVTAECGTYETWGAQSYLSLVLDKSQTTWSQRVFNNDYSLHKGPRHSFALAQFPQHFGFRHFFCSAKTRQGKEIFRQHYFVVPKGPKAPSNMKPVATMDQPSAADPQILVIQRLDPSYDGGKPIWTTPAIVRASGTIGSIAVNVFGIAFYPVTVKNLVAKWRIEHGYQVLGKVPKRDFRICARLALSKGYEYMAIIDDTSCISSWYLPLATIPFNTKYKSDAFEDRDTYFIRGVWEDYEITWLKLEQNGAERELLSYTVKWPTNYRTKVYSVKTQEKKRGHYNDGFSLITHGGKYRSFDKVYYGDTMIGSHVLNIMEMDLRDVGAYKFKVYIPGRNVRNEAVIELRHKDEPSISVPVKVGACAGSKVEIPLTILNYNELHPNEWFINWRKTSQPPATSNTLDTSDPMKLKIKATANNRGEYTVFVRNPFGFATGTVKLEITTNYPSIIWATPSPHTAIEGVSDVLEIKTKSDDHLREVLWFFNGKSIDKTTAHFSFPDDAAAGSSRRKRLKLKTLKRELKGEYKAVVKGEFCSFQHTFQVDIKVRPNVVIEPSTTFIMAAIGQNVTTLTAYVRGGLPQPEAKDMMWLKNNVAFKSSYSGRILSSTTKKTNNRWLSRLTINNPRKSDTGDYTFVLSMGTANITYQRKLRVLDAAVLEKIKTMDSSKKSGAQVPTARCDMLTLVILAAFVVSTPVSWL